MKKFVVVVTLMAFVLTGCQKKAGFADLPDAVKIVKMGGITVRSTWRKDFQPVGTVLENYTYKVLDGDPAYYRIIYVDGGIGWISAGFDKNWTERTADGRVKILVPGGIIVRKDPYSSGKSIGVAVDKYSFPVMGVEYYYLKVELPDGKEGWIYAGKPGDRWVEASRIDRVSSPVD